MSHISVRHHSRTCVCSRAGRVRDRMMRSHSGNIGQRRSIELLRMRQCWSDVRCAGGSFECERPHRANGVVDNGDRRRRRRGRVTNGGKLSHTVYAEPESLVTHIQTEMMCVCARNAIAAGFFFFSQCPAHETGERVVFSFCAAAWKVLSLAPLFGAGGFSCTYVFYVVVYRSLAGLFRLPPGVVSLHARWSVYTR